MPSAQHKVQELLEFRKASTILRYQYSKRSFLCVESQPRTDRGPDAAKPHELEYDQSRDVLEDRLHARLPLGLNRGERSCLE